MNIIRKNPAYFGMSPMGRIARSLALQIPTVIFICLYNYVRFQFFNTPGRMPAVDAAGLIFEGYMLTYLLARLLDVVEKVQGGDQECNFKTWAIAAAKMLAGVFTIFEGIFCLVKMTTPAFAASLIALAVVAMVITARRITKRA